MGMVAWCPQTLPLLTPGSRGGSGGVMEERGKGPVCLADFSQEGVTRDPFREEARILTSSSAPPHTSLLPVSASLGAKVGLLIF